MYTITDDMKAKLAEFYGNYATEAETAATIKKVYESDTGYIMDTHTAVAATVYDKYVKETGDTDSYSDRFNSKPIQVHKKCYECYRRCI